MKTLPFPLSLIGPLRSSTALVRATAVDAAVLAAHVILYPTGLAQERPYREPGTLDGPDAPDGPDGPAASEGPAGADRPDGVPDPSAPGGRRSAAHRPVLLLHGFIDNRSVFVLLRRSLRQAGRHHVEGLNYSPLTCDVPTAAAALGNRVEEVCRRTGHDRVDLVGHSLGGLIARYYVQLLGGDARVRTLVTLGTPHGGTRVVAPLLSAHPIVRQMRPGSPVIEALRQPAPHCRTRFVSFWSDVDPVVTPAEMARIDHPDLAAENVRVTGIGHLALPVHRIVAGGVCQALTERQKTEPRHAGQDGGDDASGAASVA